MDDLVPKSGGTLPPLPTPKDGPHLGVCTDIIDLKWHEESYAGQSKGWQHKCAIVFQIDETNPETKKPFEVFREFTVSLGEKANLRKFLGDWRGRQLTDAEAEAGFPLRQLVGVNAFMQIENIPTKANPEKKYPRITTIMARPAEMRRMLVTDYSRAEWWKKKIGVEEAVTKPAPMTSGFEPPEEESFDDFPVALEDQDDDLPF